MRASFRWDEPQQVVVELGSKGSVGSSQLAERQPAWHAVSPTKNLQLSPIFENLSEKPPCIMNRQIHILLERPEPGIAAIEIQQSKFHTPKLRECQTMGSNDQEMMFGKI